MVWSGLCCWRQHASCLHSTQGYNDMYFSSKKIKLRCMPCMWDSVCLQFSNIRAALEDQAALGWLSCIKGFFSTRITVARLSMHSPTTEMDAGLTWLRHIINSLHLFTTSLWKGRNDSLHHQDETRLRSSNRQEDLEITHFYNRPELLSTSDQHYCARPLSQILSFTPANRRRWLRQVKLARSRRLTNQQPQCRISQFLNRTDTIPVFFVDPTTVPSYEPPPLPAPPPPRDRNLSQISFILLNLNNAIANLEYDQAWPGTNSHSCESLGNVV